MRTRSSRIHAEFMSRQSPEAQTLALRRAPAKPGWQRRLASLPPWDGQTRFYLRDPNTGEIDDQPWSDKDVQWEAWAALRRHAAGQGAMGRYARYDLNDPPIVGADILSHPNGPYGSSPGSMTYQPVKSLRGR